MYRKLYIPCLFFFAFLFSCENNPAEVDELTRKVVEVEEGRGIYAVFSQKANLRAELIAPELRRVKADTPYTEFPKSVHVDFYKDATGVKESVVKAQYARYFETQNKVFMRDSVVVYNYTGDTLYAKTLWWDQGNNTIYSTDSVKVFTITQKIRGTGFRSKADFTEITIDNPRGPIDLPQGYQ